VNLGATWRGSGKSGWQTIKRLLARPRAHRLGYRLLGAIVLASTCLALVATGIQLYVDYQRDLSAIDAELSRLQRSQLPSLANSLWSFDETQLQLQLNGLLQLQDVKFVELRAAGGQRFAAGTPPNGESLTREFALQHAAAGDRGLGTLAVSVGLDGVYGRLVDKAIVILATTSAKTFLISLIVLWLVSRWVTRHLEHMALYARGVSLDHLGQPLRLARRPGAMPDELDQVAAALNDMSQALAAEFDCRVGIDTERLALLEAYERNRALLRAIIDNSPAVITVKDLEGRYLLVNRRCEERHRMNADAMIGKTDHEIFPADLADRLRRVDLRVIEARAPLQEEELMPLSDGMHTVLSVKAPLYDDKGVLYAVCGVQTDITERKQVERELQHYRKHLEVLVADRTADLQRANNGLKFMNLRLQQAQMQLVQSEKMASIGVLAAGVAHEINNPVSFVTANLGTLRQYAADLLKLVAAYERSDDVLAAAAPQQWAAIQRGKVAIGLSALRDDVDALGDETSDGLARVTKIVRDLRDFAHAGDHEWQLADLHAGLDSTLNIARHELKHKVDVVREYGELPQVECLPSQMNQVFMNLFINAAHAVFERGELRIRTGLEGAGAWIEVTDTGCGIAQENLQRIFEPFFTTKPVGQGTGLGLALAYTIVQKHKGRLEVTSSVGRGSTFRIWLPLVQQLRALAA
jgi:two-component system, NtrC family, sensor kinase